MEFKVKVKFVFTGVISVNADDAAQATEYIEKHVGMTTDRGIHTSLTDKEIPDWDFPVHPDKTVYKPKPA